MTPQQTLTAGSIVLAILFVMIAYEYARVRKRKRRRVRDRHALQRRRNVGIEERLLDAFRGPRETYGEIFSGYTVWETSAQTSLEIKSGPGWRNLNDFTHALVARHLWRALARLVRDPIVLIDSGSIHLMRWTALDTERFNDYGYDPWSPNARVGTLVRQPQVRPQLPNRRPRR